MIISIVGSGGKTTLLKKMAAEFRSEGKTVFVTTTTHMFIEDDTLLTEDAPVGGRACWASPVKSDIVDASGHKLAGAGQRRYKGAVLHQGLIQQCVPAEGWPERLAHALAAEVSIVEGAEPYPGFNAELETLCRTKYETAEWNDETKGRRKPTAKN